MPASSSERSLKWICVSHLSRLWRNVAINDASLWTNPPSLKNPEWTMTMLERSRMVTIPAPSLKVDELDNRVAAALTPHITRVAVLVIPRMARETLERVLSGLPSTAPNLEALSINSLAKVTFGTGSWYKQISYPHVYLDEAMAIPDDVLCHTPKLQRLELNDIIIKCDSPLLSNLTTLSMTGIPDKSKPTPQQFKMMLKPAPYLKRLALKGVGPSAGSSQQAGWATPVLMEHLEYLDIEETVPRIMCFFRNLLCDTSSEGTQSWRRRIRLGASLPVSCVRPAIFTLHHWLKHRR
ncbi:hypothetical protein D9619_003541 [Psilocybe cf. subviscida]|uniref:F-box domain-containing protein n=1 Tax=Psilocybe cf. subviscida TaxID=2480587 RepID=A0A8H5AXA8_9AGAR|nr:hypothetical protein D9619_003541 [Psilocybe cf. subviscida]